MTQADPQTNTADTITTAAPVAVHRLNYVAMLISLAVLLCDQLSKWFVSHYLILYDPVPVLPFFNLVLAHNTGAAFSFLSGARGWAFVFLVSVAVAACSVIVLWLHRLPSRANRLSIGLSFVLGGALGNLTDRLMHGYVVDFIDLFYKAWHWPVFNIADVAINVGAACVLTAVAKKGSLHTDK